MAEHKTEIELRIGGNAEKKLNDLIERADELLKKIEDLEKASAEDSKRAGS